MKPSEAMKRGLEKYPDIKQVMRVTLDVREGKKCACALGLILLGACEAPFEKVFEKYEAADSQALSTKVFREIGLRADTVHEIINRNDGFGQSFVYILAFLESCGQ